jgi:hypothetical protein
MATSLTPPPNPRIPCPLSQTWERKSYELKPIFPFLLSLVIRK